MTKDELARKRGLEPAGKDGLSPAEALIATMTDGNPEQGAHRAEPETAALPEEGATHEGTKNLNIAVKVSLYEKIKKVALPANRSSMTGYINKLIEDDFKKNADRYARVSMAIEELERMA